MTLESVRDVGAELNSDDFETWSAIARPRLVVAFAGAENLRVDQAEALIEHTLELARDNWTEICESETPNSVWAYRAAFKLLHEGRDLVMSAPVRRSIS